MTRRATLRNSKQLGISELNKTRLKLNNCSLVSELDFKSIAAGPGVYIIRALNEKRSPLYAGETNQLASRLAMTFDPSGPLSHWRRRCEELEVFMIPVPSVTDYRLARQSLLLKWYSPEWNSVKALSA